jgi:hypothetical protein
MNKNNMVLIPAGSTWDMNSLHQIQPVTVPLTFKAVHIQNNTKTVTVHMGVDNGELVVIITNEEEDSKFKFGG